VAGTAPAPRRSADPGRWRRGRAVHVGSINIRVDSINIRVNSINIRVDIINIRVDSIDIRL